ncbi:Gfo/Idh/MocA family oxidoreductase [Aerococcus viridans]|uniref:Gfo/Idh/MocA family protein n=1 Tax=Aerococcus viridans TaxID=1377 RepID=UPI0028FDC21F|nr:Gfo/Idh/MocA family oxidoreductase [Aerococcus viridans]
MIKWGIIGAGNIANRFADSLEEVTDGELYAVANRTIEKAEAFKANHPCEKAYGSYQELLDDDQVDAVYIALPHKYHLEWVLQAIDAGKAILCEKPATINQAEVSEIEAALDAKPVFFMEAMKSRFTPTYQAVKELVAQGEIGEIKAITTSLCRKFEEADASYHFEPGQGGCLLDMGVYNVALLEDFLPGEFILKHLDYHLHESRVEVYVNAVFDVNGKEAVLESGFDRLTDAKAVIKGSKGEIVIYDFHRPTKFDFIVGDKVTNNEILNVVDDFYGEITHVHANLKAGRLESNRMSMADTKKLAGIIDQVKAEIFE